MDNDSRTQKSLKNIFSSFYTYFLNIILQFLNRTIFLAYLSLDYLGINGLFSNSNFPASILDISNTSLIKERRY